jgi:hypothetical protein
MSDQTTKRIKDLEQAAGGAVKGVADLADGLGKLTAAGASLEASVERYGTALKGNRKVVADLTKAIGAAKDIVGSFGKVFSEVLGGLGGSEVSAFMGLMGNLGQAITSVGSVAIQAGETLGEVFDAPSREIRLLDGAIFELNKRFSGTVEAASDFSDAMLRQTGSQFSRDLYITRSNLLDMAEAAKGTELTLDQLGQTVSTVSGETTLLAAAYAFSEASGMGARTTMDALNTIINKQGVSASEATKMLGVYAGTSEATGLSIDKVSRSLNSAVSNFSKLGASADFGRPALEGFSRVVRDMGIGIEEADRLAQNFSASLLGLTTNYSNAFVVQQRSGMDFGGGSGALGASIGLQAQMLQAEQTGDQTALAANLASAMKDTIASFGGGDIVTVSEAAESPELQSRFYTQQQLLMNQFGLRDEGSANRTLEYLQKLDEATRTGNVEAQQEFEALINNEKEGRDQLLDSSEKLLVEARIQSDLLALVAREPFMKLKAAGDIAVENFLRPEVSSIGATGREKIAAGMDSGVRSLIDVMGKFINMDPTEATGLFMEKGAEISSQRGAQAAALTVRELDPRLIEATLNQIQRETPGKAETLDELISLMATSDNFNGLRRGSDATDEEYKKALLDYLKEINNDTNVKIQIEVGDSGNLEAYAKVIKQLEDRSTT